jgi:hypothetical protein
MQNHPALVTGLAALAGKKLISACSSLKNFSMEFESGLGLRIDASMDEDEPVLSAIVVEAHTLPKASDAVCSVDWTWIYGSNIKKYGVSSNFVKFELDGIGPLTVSAGVWSRSSLFSLLKLLPRLSPSYTALRSFPPGKRDFPADICL